MTGTRRLLTLAACSGGGGGGDDAKTADVEQGIDLDYLTEYGLESCADAISQAG